MKKILVLLTLFTLTTISVQANDLFRSNAVFYDKTAKSFSEYFDGSVKPLKTGEAQCTSYFHLVSTGDCSIKKAMEDAGIKRVNYLLPMNGGW